MSANGGVSGMLENNISGTINKQIETTKTKLNAKIQNELDEVLNKLGYDKVQQEIDELQSKSAELQKDLDKAEKLLGRMGDFDGFMDGLTAKYTGKITEKYEAFVGKIKDNMKLANSALSGMSFVVDGMPAGDVVTMVKPKKEKKWSWGDSNLGPLII